MLRLSCSSDGRSQEQKGQTRYWSAHEHKRFLEALQLLNEELVYDADLEKETKRQLVSTSGHGV